MTPDSAPRPTSAERATSDELVADLAAVERDVRLYMSPTAGGSPDFGIAMLAVLDELRAARATIRRLEAEGAGYRDAADSFESEVAGLTERAEQAEAENVALREALTRAEDQRKNAIHMTKLAQRGQEFWRTEQEKALEAKSSASARETALRRALEGLVKTIDESWPTYPYNGPIVYAEEVKRALRQARAVLATPAPAGGEPNDWLKKRAGEKRPLTNPYGGRTEASPAGGEAVDCNHEWSPPIFETDSQRFVRGCKKCGYVEQEERQGAGPEEK